MKIIKKIKAKLYSLFHPTSIRSWFLMWIFSICLAFILEIAIYYLLIVPFFNVENFGPENIWTAYKVCFIAITIAFIYKYRKLLF